VKRIVLSLVLAGAAVIGPAAPAALAWTPLCGGHPMPAYHLGIIGHWTCTLSGWRWTVR
jgi:hypothetical protein